MTAGAFRIGVFRRIPVVVASSFPVTGECLALHAAGRLARQAAGDDTPDYARLARLFTPGEAAPGVLGAWLTSPSVPPDTDGWRVGFASIEPSALAPEHQYLGDDSRDDAVGARLDNRLARLLLARSRKWDAVEEMGATIRGAARLSTDLIGEVLLPVVAPLIWPRLAPSRTLSLGRARLGAASTEVTVKVINPSDSPVWVQLTDGAGTALYEQTLATRRAAKDTEEWGAYEAGPEGSAATRVSLAASDIFAIDPVGSRVRLLLPGESASLGPVVFSPPTRGAYSSWVYVRNNLTTFDAILIHGFGSAGDLEFHECGEIAVSIVSRRGPASDGGHSSHRYGSQAASRRRRAGKAAAGDDGGGDGDGEEAEAEAGAAGGGVGAKSLPPASPAHINAAHIEVTAAELPCSSRESREPLLALGVPRSIERRFTVTNRGAWPLQTLGAYVGATECGAHGIELVDGCARNMRIGVAESTTLRIRITPLFIAPTLEAVLAIRTKGGGAISVNVSAALPHASLQVRDRG